MDKIQFARTLIIPLESWFDKSITQGRVAVYEEVLMKFTCKTLERALANLKQDWKQQSMPQPAVILEYCINAKDHVKKNDGELNFGEFSRARN